VNPIVKRLIQIDFLILIQAVALFGAAWRLDWVEGWAYLGLYLAFIALNAVLTLEAGQRRVGQGTQPDQGEREGLG
jgi:uncharacterized SAM-binding protein YcdF (DUF218 family)